MDILAKDELKALVQTQTQPGVCVSIYMPTYRPGSPDVQQNPLRFRKLLEQAQQRLTGTGLKRAEADKYLEPAERLLEDTFFWLNVSDGLAVFLSRDYFRYYRLPAQFPELVAVANRFHVKPLLTITAADGLFYVLAISQKTVRLLQCTRFSFNEVNIAGKIPRSLAEALRYDDVDREAQYHQHSGRGVPGLGNTGVTAHGDEVEDTKDNLLRFFFLVDRGLQREILHNETAPLVVMGVDYLFPIYRKANTYRHLLDKEVEGNPDKMAAHELHRLAVSVVEPQFKKRQEEATRIYRESAGLGRATTDLDKIVAESYNGRVYILFVAANQQKWGSYDPVANKVETHSQEESRDVDLLDFAVSQTLAHRGEVYAVEADKVPGGGPAAAALRY
ncbi:MAG: hypothetical protein Q7T04_02210 [Dehalococcoidia bacterium]|nr:hypothetical protein [Dehalococcoidia bacterium]